MSTKFILRAFVASLFFSLLLLPATHAQTTGVDPSKPFTLQSMKNYYRPVLVFAPSVTPEFQEQLRLLAAKKDQFAELDIVVLALPLTQDQPTGVVFNKAQEAHMTEADAAAARKRFHIAPGSFTVLVLGKDGEEKLRSATPVPWQRIDDLIESMPGRQDEVKDRTKK